ASANRQVTGCACVRDTGHGANFSHDSFDRSVNNLCGSVARTYQPNLHRQEMIRPESRFDPLQPYQTEDQETRANQENERESNFRSHENAARPLAYSAA